MCIFSAPSIPKDNSAELARQREQQREADIRQGRQNIDEAFARYDDPYYAGVQKDYEDYYLPQVDKQYRDAARDLKLNLSRTGNLNAGAGARNLGDLSEAFKLQRVNFANKALDATNQYRQSVEGAKSDLYSQNRASADPAAIAVSAASQAGLFETPPSQSPLPALFADFVNNASLGIAAERGGYPGFRTGLFKPKASSTVSYVR